MSTRCQIQFHRGEEKTASAMVYRHSDGYPETEHGVLATMQTFFKELKDNVQDTRFGDPEYLAAKFVVWQAKQYSRDSHFLDFLSVGISMELHGDIEYLYHVHCNSDYFANDLPTVTFEMV